MNRTCPTHGTPLRGGPVHYTCDHRHGVVAADLPHEFKPTSTPVDTPLLSARIDHAGSGPCGCGMPSCPGWLEHQDNRADLNDAVNAYRRWAA